MLIYIHKIQLVRGEKFWKVDPSHDMKPPEVHKFVGGPKLKRKREKDEARKREGVWSTSRKGLKLTCRHCRATGHNQRRCPMVCNFLYLVNSYTSYFNIELILPFL